MLPTKEKKMGKELTADERADIWKVFNSVIEEMKLHTIPDIDILKKAYNMAFQAHENLRRKTGEPYIFHPLYVAKILAENGRESDMVAAAILHDVVTVSEFTLADLEIEFGTAIVDLVNAVTKMDELLIADKEMSKEKIDELSDIKFLNEASHNIKALYIKCADRMHNLRTISIFSEEKQKEKAYHTRSVIIPAAKKFQMHKFVDELSDLCLEIEDPIRFSEISQVYQDTLKRKYETFEGESGVIKNTIRIIKEDGRCGKYVENIIFSKRCIDSLYADILKQVHNIGQIQLVFAKNLIPLYDLHLISKDDYADTPETLFFSLYDKLHDRKYNRFGFTIIDVYEDNYERYFLMSDKLGNRYRLFIQSSKKYMEYKYGVLAHLSNEPDYGNEAESGTSEQKMISVFKKDGSRMQIAQGATVLDFAFAIDPNIGICAKYAHLNNSASYTPIYTRLKPGDMVHVIADHNKLDQRNDTPHATVRWFEYLYTREAIKKLSRWLEKHMDMAVPKMLVYDAEGKEYEIEMASTVLDFAFEVGVEVGLHVKCAYINKSNTPVALDKVLRYGDKVRFEYDLKEDKIPLFGWIGIVKTRKAKECLIEYFDKMYRNKD